MPLCSQPNRPRFNGPPDGYCNYGSPMYGGRPPRPRPPGPPGPPGQPGPPRPPMPRQMRPPRPNFQQPRMPPQPHMYPPRPVEPPPHPMEQPRLARNTPSPPPILDRRCVEIDSYIGEPKLGQKQEGLARRYDRHGNQIKYKYLEERAYNGPACLYCGTSFTEKKVSSIVLAKRRLRLSSFGDS